MSESDVLVTEEAEEDYIGCELCREPLHELSVESRQAHYEDHFNNGDGLEVNELDAQLAASLAQSSSPYRGVAPVSRNSGTQDGIWKARENLFWHSACPSPPPKIITPGILPLVQQALERSKSGGALCTPLIAHYGTELWDLGWGCGYRNFLMACSALVAQEKQPEYRALLMNDSCGPPGVRNLQVWIEDAWRRGYDTQGAAQLRRHLVGTRKWIGTAELYVAFISRGVPAKLVDFPNNGHAHTALIQWLTMHFLENSDGPSRQGVLMTSRMPVVLQHKGHSRTIVGIEFAPSGETNVLIFDPARRPSAALRKAGLRIHAGVDAIPVPNEQNKSPNKAKDFLKRVIKKRPRTLGDEQASKRVRGGSEKPDDRHRTGNDRSRGLDLDRVLGAYRVSATELGRKDQYQVLWFPMTAPLGKSERDALKVVTSERVTVSAARS